MNFVQDIPLRLGRRLVATRKEWIPEYPALPILPPLIQTAHCVSGTNENPSTSR
jgi:hypothetical protein